MQKIPRLVRWILSVALFLFVLMFVMRLCAYWTFKPAEMSFSSVSKALWLGFRFDAREVGIFCLLLLMVGSIKPFHPFNTGLGKRITLSMLLIALLSMVVFYVFDFLHFRYLLQRLNASALSFLADAKISAGMVWQTYPVIRILIAMLVSLFVLYRIGLMIYKRIEKSAYTSGKANRMGWGIVVFFLCSLSIFGRIGQFPLRWSDAFDLGSDFQANLALNPFQSFFSSLSFRSSSFDIGKVKKYYPLMSSYLGITTTDTSKISFERSIRARPETTLSIKPNIVLIICESFSAYKSSMWGNPLNTTPYINELSKQGLFFDNCFTPAYGTARGVWASITGVPDVELTKTASRNPSMVDQHSIISDFDGYDHFYFLGGSTSWANIRGVLTNNIKDLHLYEEQDYSSPKIDVWGISDKNLFKEANNVLRQQNSPFFAVIQTADNHRPYTIAKEDAIGFEKINFPADSLKRYGFDSNDELNAFRFTDFCVQSFIERARKEKYFDNTIFMFIGDHGIGGNAGHMFPAAWTENGLVQYHVPLLFYAPKLITPQRLHCVASQVDVLPTLAGMANISYRNTTLGRDLLESFKQDSGKNNIAFIVDPNTRDMGVIKGEWFYTRNYEGSRQKMLWADFSKKQNDNKPDSLKEEYSELTSAFYETSRFLLKNNKKQ